MLFSEISGNEKLIAKLKLEVQTGRIPHARMISGHEGDAKLRIALAYVQYLMCENRTDNDSCGVCKACVKNVKLIHPDVHFSFPVVPKKPNDKPTSNDYLTEWRKAVLSDQHLNLVDWLNTINAENKQGNITAEECKSILSKLGLKPFESDKRLLLMWLPEYLGGVGNSLLKIMEEPPDKTYFVLVTGKMENILPTILSRVQLNRVFQYSSSEIKAELMKLDIEEKMADNLSFMSVGNLNSAIKLIDHSHEAFDPTEHFQQWMRFCFKYQIPEIFKWTDSTAALGRENIKAFLSYALSLVRECLATRMSPDYEIKLGEKEAEFVRNFSRALQFTNIETLYVEINRTIGEIERNANPKITLLNLSIELGTAFTRPKKAQSLT